MDDEEHVQRSPRIPEDVLRHIAAYLPDDEVVELEGVSSLFFNEALSRFYEAVDLRGLPVGSEDMIQHMMEPHIAHRVRSLYLDYLRPPTPYSPTQVQQPEILWSLVRAIGVLPNLDTLHLTWKKCAPFEYAHDMFGGLPDLWTAIAPRLRTLHLDLDSFGMQTFMFVNGGLARQLETFVLTVISDFFFREENHFHVTTRLQLLVRHMILPTRDTLRTLRVHLHPPRLGVDTPEADQMAHFVVWHFFNELAPASFPRMSTLEIAAPFSDVSDSKMEESMGKFIMNNIRTGVLCSFMVFHERMLEATENSQPLVCSQAYMKFLTNGAAQWQGLTSISLAVPYKVQPASSDDEDAVVTIAKVLGALRSSLIEVNITGRPLSLDELATIMKSMETQSITSMLRTLGVYLDLVRPSTMDFLAATGHQLHTLELRFRDMSFDGDEEWLLTKVKQKDPAIHVHTATLFHSQMRARCYTEWALRRLVVRVFGSNSSAETETDGLTVDKCREFLFVSAMKKAIPDLVREESGLHPTAC